MSKQEFTEQAKHSMKQISEKIEALHLKTKSATSEMKEKHQHHIHDLEEKKAALEKQYHEVNSMADDKWNYKKDSFKIDLAFLNEKLKHMLD